MGENKIKVLWFIPGFEKNVDREMKVCKKDILVMTKWYLRR